MDIPHTWIGSFKGYLHTYWGTTRSVRTWQNERSKDTRSMRKEQNSNSWSLAGHNGCFHNQQDS